MLWGNPIATCPSSGGTNIQYFVAILAVLLVILLLLSGCLVLGAPPPATAAAFATGISLITVMMIETFIDIFALLLFLQAGKKPFGMSCFIFEQRARFAEGYDWSCAASAASSPTASASAAKDFDDTPPPVATIAFGIAAEAAIKLDADVAKLWETSWGTMASSEFVTSVVLIALMASV